MARGCVPPFSKKGVVKNFLRKKELKIFLWYQKLYKECGIKVAQIILSFLKFFGELENPFFQGKVLIRTLLRLSRAYSNFIQSLLDVGDEVVCVLQSA